MPPGYLPKALGELVLAQFCTRLTACRIYGPANVATLGERGLWDQSSKRIRQLFSVRPLRFPKRNAGQFDVGMGRVVRARDRCANFRRAEGPLPRSSGGCTRRERMDTGFRCDHTLITLGGDRSSRSFVSGSEKTEKVERRTQLMRHDSRAPQTT